MDGAVAATMNSNGQTNLHMNFDIECVMPAPLNMPLRIGRTLRSHPRVVQELWSLLHFDRPNVYAVFMPRRRDMRFPLTPYGRNVAGNFELEET
jgi:hypothetical protein